jgi:hypothetical protein
MNREMRFSIGVPLYNEAASVTPLYVRLTQVMVGLDEPYEIARRSLIRRAASRSASVWGNFGD